jgi:hypothetical protein
MEKARSTRTVFRLIAALPPLLGASVVSNLGRITNFTGISGFAVAFVFPSLLQIYSKELMQRRGYDPYTHYSCFLTKRVNVVLTLCVGLFLVIFVVASLTIAAK